MDSGRLLSSWATVTVVLQIFDISAPIRLVRPKAQAVAISVTDVLMGGEKSRPAGKNRLRLRARMRALHV